MSDATPSLRQLNRTFVGSVLFIDIVGYATRTVPDQLEMKELFNTMLAEAVQHVAASERIMVDTGDGAAIAFLGDPEDALFAALSLRDAIEAAGITVGEQGFVRMGINLGPLRLVRDINGHTTMIGDGVNDAQRTMSFAEPGEVMASHSYFDMVSRFSRDYAQLFIYEGTCQDKNVREHQVYRFGLPKDHDDLAEKLRDRSRARHSLQDDAALAATAAPTMDVVDAVHHTPPAAPRKTVALRPGVIMTAIGAVTVVGAVWSWSSKPAPQPVKTVVAPISFLPDAPLRTKVESAKAAEIRADVRLAAKSHDLKAKEPIPTTPPDNTETKDDTTPKPAEAPAKPGIVRLSIHPWGEVFVDGGRRGVSPPMKSFSLPPGKHQVEIRNGSFAPYKETIEVKSGGEFTVQYAF